MYLTCTMTPVGAPGWVIPAALIRFMTRASGAASAERGLLEVARSGLVRGRQADEVATRNVRARVVPRLVTAVS